MIIQINIWQCELCPTIETTWEEASPFDDPVILPPNGMDWGYFETDGKEFLVCPSCKAKNPEAKGVGE